MTESYRDVRRLPRKKLRTHNPKPDTIVFHEPSYFQHACRYVAAALVGNNDLVDPKLFCLRHLQNAARSWHGKKSGQSILRSTLFLCLLLGSEEWSDQYFWW